MKKIRQLEVLVKKLLVIEHWTSGFELMLILIVAVIKYRSDLCLVKTYNLKLHISISVIWNLFSLTSLRGSYKWFHPLSTEG